MQTENEITQKEKFTQLLEWAQDAKYCGTEEIKTMVNDLFEAWLSTDYAHNAQQRNAFLVDCQFLKEGLAVISNFTQADFENLQSLIKTPAHVS